jgi:hypothetical protein
MPSLMELRDPGVRLQGLLSSAKLAAVRVANISPDSAASPRYYLLKNRRDAGLNEAAACIGNRRWYD